MPITITDTANEKSTFALEMAITDENGDPLTPNTLTWTLTDLAGNVINERAGVEITTPASTVTVGLLRYRLDGGAFRRQDWRLVQRMVGVSTFEEFVAKQDELHRSLFDFTKGRREEQPRDMVNEYRRLIEGQTAINFADDLEGAVVAVDGTLSEFPKQFEFMDRLVKVCEKRGHLLVGISKDSQLHAFGHVLTDEDLMARVQSRLPREALAYARAPKASEASKEGLLYGDIYYARLHPRARKWFRVDLGTFRDQPDFAFGQLAPYARSLV